LVSTFWEAAFWRAMAALRVRDPVADFRSVVFDADQIEPAEYRAVLGDEHAEGR
jgi:hypothetical protein